MTCENNENRSFMELKEALKKPFPITYEIASPKGIAWEPHVNSFLTMDIAPLVGAINVPYNPTARVKVDPAPYAGLIKKKTGLDVIPHMTCRGNTASNMQSWLFGLYMMSIKNVLVVTGDMPMMGDYPTEPGTENLNALELITGIKRYLSQGYLMPELATRPLRMKNRYVQNLEKIDSNLDFTVGGVILPRRSNEVTYTVEKIKADIDFFQTQITYSAESIINFIEKLSYYDGLRKVPILVGTAPMVSKKSVVFISERILNNTMDPKIKKRLLDSKNIKKESVEVCSELYENIADGMKERGLDYPVGAHVMSLLAPRMAAEIIRRISLK